MVTGFGLDPDLGLIASVLAAVPSLGSETAPTVHSSAVHPRVLGHIPKSPNIVNMPIKSTRAVPYPERC